MPGISSGLYVAFYPPGSPERRTVITLIWKMRLRGAKHWPEVPWLGRDTVRTQVYSTPTPSLLTHQQQIKVSGTPQLSWSWSPSSSNSWAQPSGYILGNAALGLPGLCHLSLPGPAASQILFLGICGQALKQSCLCFPEPVWISSCLYFTAGKSTFFTQGDNLTFKNCALMVEFLS